MRICLITPGFGGAGAEVIALNSANYYIDKGFKVTLFSFQKNGPILSQLSDQVSLKFVNPRSYFSLSCAIGNNQLYFDHVISFIRHANISAFIACLFGKLKTSRLHLIDVNTFDQQSNLSRLSRLWQNILLFAAYHTADDVIAVSSLVQRQIISKYHIKKSRVLGNPCLKANDLLSRRPTIKAARSNRHFVAAGRLHPQKDFGTLIRVFDRYISETKSFDTLTIYGEGAQHSELQALIANLNADKFIFMKGYTDDLLGAFNHYDAFIMSSIYEGFGNVIVLAMAAGLPIIARKDTGGPDDLVTADTGLLFDNEDMLLNILKTICIADFSSDKLRKAASKYTISSICDQYLLG